MKMFIFFILLSVFCFAQTPQVIDVEVFGYGSGATIEQITGTDSVYWRGDVGKNVDPTAWYMFTDSITAAEKTAESTHTYILADEDYWTWYNGIQFKIEQGDSSITSQWVYIGNTNGCLTFSVKCDTSGTTTTYYGRLGGN